jgi:hypothetical protein
MTTIESGGEEQGSSITTGYRTTLLWDNPNGRDTR